MGRKVVTIHRFREKLPPHRYWEPINCNFQSEETDPDPVRGRTRRSVLQSCDFCSEEKALEPTGLSLSEDLGTNPSFILTEYDQDLWVLRGCCEGLKSPKEV